MRAVAGTIAGFVLKFQVLRLVELRMPRTGGTPRIVPYGADQTVYLVIDRFSGLGSVYRETEAERVDLETVIADGWNGNLFTGLPLNEKPRLEGGSRRGEETCNWRYR
jgi:hypothetical protein